MPTALVTAAAAVAVAVLFNALNPAPVGQPDVATRHHEGSADDAERAACSKVHAVIIGAGPAGLAVAARLMNLGVPFVVLEKSLDAGTSWRGRYDRLHLHTHKDISSLPFWPFPAHFPTYISKDDLADYYAGFAKLLGHHLQLGVEVTSARRVDNQWEVRAADGRRWRAGAIVLCTGQEGTPRVPELDGASSFAGQLMHSSRYVNGAAYRGKRVLVVGAGNSGGEITLDLWEHGAANVTMLARSPVHVLPRWLANMPFLGSRPFALQRYHTPLWLSDLLNRHVVMPLLFADLESHGLRLKWDDGIKTHIFKHHSPPLLDIGTIDLIRRGEVQVVSAPIQTLTADGATFTDGSRAPFDLIVLATGYDKQGAPHSRILPKEILSHILSEHGYVESGRSAAAPGLFFSGFTDHSGRLAEIHDESAVIADQIARDHVPPFDRTGRRADLLRSLGGLARKASALPPACQAKAD